MALRGDSTGPGLREPLRFPSRLLARISIGRIDRVSLGLGATDGRSREGELGSAREDGASAPGPHRGPDVSPSCDEGL